MISCSQCQHQEIHGAIFCSNCGSQLIPERLILDNHDPQEENRELQEEWVSLVLMNQGQVLSKHIKNELTIGRTSEGQAEIPDIDLTQYDAYTLGVSRLHCIIRRSGSKPSVEDLNSSNGTYLNGKRLESNLETPFKNGDVLSLGGFNIKLLLHFNIVNI